MFWQAAFCSHRGLDMVKKECHVWSPICTNFASFNKANCKTYLGDKTKNKDFMKSVLFTWKALLFKRPLARNCNSYVLLVDVSLLLLAHLALVPKSKMQSWIVMSHCYHYCHCLWTVLATGWIIEIFISCTHMHECPTYMHINI